MTSDPDPGAGPGTAGSVTSADGTPIGFRSWGSGPGLVVLHGAMESSGDYTELAAALAPHRSVHVVDRRGRGRSGPHRGAHELADEVADVVAVLRATRAEHLFGVSSGAVVALMAALELPELVTVAAYEPALTVAGQDDARGRRYLARYETAIDRGDHASAIVWILRGLRVGPRWLRLLPVPVATALIRRLGAEEEREGGPDTAGFVSLAPTVRHDLRVADQGSAELARLDDLTLPTLLLGGDRGPRYLRAALADLAERIPGARRVELRGAGHGAASDGEHDGRPAGVADALLRFWRTADG